MSIAKEHEHIYILIVVVGLEVACGSLGGSRVRIRAVAAFGVRSRTASGPRNPKACLPAKMSMNRVRVIIGDLSL